MLKRRAAFFLLTLALLPAAFSAQAQAPKEDQLRTMQPGQIGMVKTLMQQEHAWNAGDMNGFLAGYKNAPETMWIGHVLAKGFDNISAQYHQSYPVAASMGKLTFSDLEPRVLDEKFGTLIGAYHLDRAKKFGGNADGVFSLVFEKTPDGWKIVLDHTT